MSEKREQFRARIGNTAFQGVFGTDARVMDALVSEGDWADAGEAVATQVLRDVIVDIGTFTIDRDYWGNDIPASDYIKAFAADRGLDLGEQS